MGAAPFLIRALALGVLLSSPVYADSYQGLTLGEPIPDTTTPRSAQLWADKLKADMLPDDMLDICTHELLPLGGGHLRADTLTCDGPVVRISATEPISAFFDSGNPQPPVTTNLSGLVFKETTLSEARARFGSEGLIAGRWFGKTDPDNVGAFALAYEVADTDTVAAFWFQIPRASGWQLNSASDEIDPARRDTAVLISIDLMTTSFFDSLNSGQAGVASERYTPLPQIFLTPR